MATPILRHDSHRSPAMESLHTESVEPESLDMVTPVERVFDYAGALRRYWRIVALTAVLATGAALFLSLTSAKLYDATAKVLVSNSEPIDVVSHSNSRSADPERDLNTGIALVKLNDIAQAAVEKLGRPVSGQQLLSEVKVGPEGNSSVIGIKVRDPSASRAARLANAFAEQYLIFRRDAARGPYVHAADSARGRLEALGPDARKGAEGQALLDRINELTVASTVQTGGVQLVNRATPSASPATPHTRLNVAAGLLAGLFLGSVLAFGLDRWRSGFFDARAPS
jgi:tyrosine-protein kinase